MRQGPTEIQGCRYVLNVIQTRSVVLELQFVQIVILALYLMKTELNVVTFSLSANFDKYSVDTSIKMSHRFDRVTRLMKRMLKNLIHS